MTNVFEEERVEVFRGHFDECLAHFGSAFNKHYPKSKRHRNASVQPISDFVESNTTTITRWLDDPENSKPTGLFRIKLSCYLDSHGYRIIEFEKLSKVVRGFSEVIGYGIMPIQEAVSLVGYTYPSEFYNVFLGRGNSVSPLKEKAMMDIYRIKREEIEKRRNEISRDGFMKIITEKTPMELLLKSSNMDEDESPRSVPTLVTSKRETKPTTTKNNSLSVSISFMNGLLGLIDEDFLKDVTDSDLEALNHEEVSCIVRLSSYLSSLSSDLIRVRMK